MENIKGTEKKKNAFTRHIQFILLLYLAGICILYLVYLFSPKYYRVSVSIVRPSEKPLSKTESADKPDSKEAADDPDLLLSILKSRKMQEDIISRFNLLKAYRTKDMDTAVSILAKRTRIDGRKKHVIELVFMDTDPGRASLITGYYVENLNSIMKSMAAVNPSSLEQEWIEGKLSEIRERISLLDARISELQSRYDIVADSDLSQLTRISGRLSEDIYLKTLELKKKESSGSAGQEDITRLKGEIALLRRTLSDLASLKGLLLPLLRELSVQEALYGSFAARVEEVRRTEAAFTPVAQVVDPAGVPERITRPDLRLLLVINTAVCGILAFVILFFDLLKHLGSI